MTTLDVSELQDLKKVGQAISGDLRLRILNLLRAGEKNLNEIAKALEVPLSTTTVNVQKLEDAGLLKTDFRPGIRGTQKVCSLAYKRICFHLADVDEPEQQEVISMPLGNYALAEPLSPCGICTTERQLGPAGDSRIFFFPSGFRRR